jgi:hypothetical protein
MKPIASILTGFLLGAAALAQAATTYTYTYTGPNMSSGDHLVITFTTSAPLAPSKSYISKASAAVLTDSISVVSPAGSLLPNFSLPLSTFQIHSDANGNIDAWDLLGDVNNLTSGSPMSGTDWQAYSINTLKFIPGSDIPGAVGLVTGPYDYEQATEITFYTSCGLAPAGSSCQLAGNGQPYVGNYSAIINPSKTDGTWWKLAVNNPPPPPPPPVPPLTLSGSLPNGQVGVPYSASLTATGGVAPYTWAVTNFGAADYPVGLAFSSGVFSGAPTVAGNQFKVNVSVQDSAGTVLNSSYPVSIAAAPSLSCTKPKGARQGQGQAAISEVGPGYIKVGGVKVSVPACATIHWNGGASAFAVGQQAEWEGYTSATTGNVATIVTID